MTVWSFTELLTYLRIKISPDMAHDCKLSWLLVILKHQRVTCRKVICILNWLSCALAALPSQMFDCDCDSHAIVLYAGLARDL